MAMGVKGEASRFSPYNVLPAKDFLLHGIEDPGHDHVIVDPCHTHSVIDPGGHDHGIPRHRLGAVDPERYLAEDKLITEMICRYKGGRSLLL